MDSQLFVKNGLTKSSKKITFNSLNALPKKQQGASMIFCALFVPVMAIAIILLSNITQLVLEKIRLQQTVDQAALAAATIQSIGMNELADLNNAAQVEFDMADSLLTPYTWVPVASVTAAVQYHQQILTGIDSRRRAANTQYAALAHQYAQNVVDMNLPNNSDIEPLVSVNPNDNKLVEYIPRPNETGPFTISYYTSYCSGWTCNGFGPIWSTPSATTEFTATMPQRWGVSGFSQAVGGGVQVFNPPVVKWEKIESFQTYAAYKLTQRQKRFAIGPNFLSSFFPEITVYAAAKPTGGHLFNAEPEYEPRLVHLGQLTPPPEVPDLQRVDH